jgi:hypothetical protein
MSAGLKRKVRVAGFWNFRLVGPSWYVGPMAGPSPGASSSMVISVSFASALSGGYLLSDHFRARRDSDGRQMEA